LIDSSEKASLIWRYQSREVLVSRFPELSWTDALACPIGVFEDQSSAIIPKTFSVRALALIAKTDNAANADKRTIH